MKLQITPKLNSKTQQGTELKSSKQQKASNDVAFTGAEMVLQQGLRFLDTNQAWGANFVDLAFMVTPRSAVDFTRGPDAGMETMRREGSGTANHMSVGAYGMGAALLLAKPLNKKFDIKIHNTFASNSTVHILGQNWDEQIKSGNIENTLDGFLEKTIKNLQGFNPSHKEQVDGYVGLTEEAQKEAVNKFKQVIKEGFEAETKDSKTAKLSKEAHAYLKTVIGSSVESESQFRINSGDLKEVLPLDTFIDNLYKLGKTFMKEKVGTEFTKGASFADNAFIKGLKHLNTKTSLLGLGIASLIGCNIQPMNMYLTKKKTGKSGFVGGGEDRQPDHSGKFKLLKAGAAAAFGGLVLSTIGNPKKLLPKLQFQGFVPTINQLKVVYGMTIMSRFLVARDKDELREATTKDTLGFLNWMVLGAFVKNIAALAFEKNTKLGDFLRYHETEHGKGLFNKITKSSLVSRDEVLFNALKELGISTIKDGKALSYKEMVKALPKGHAALKKIKFIGAAQLIGYAYSGLVLGIGIPKLNIAVTNSIAKKRKAAKKDFSSIPANQVFLKEKTKTLISFAG